MGTSILRIARYATGISAFIPVVLYAQTVQPRTTSAPTVLSLADALQLATGTSEQVAIAKAGEQRARGQQLQARSARLPQLGTTLNWQKQLQNQFAAATKSATRNTPVTDTTSGDDPTAGFARIFASEYNLSFGLTASVPLYTGGRNAANIRAARASRDAADIGITSAQAQVQLDVTQAYFDALLTDQLLVIADSSLVQSERTLRQVELTRSVGSTSEFELIRARVTRDNQRPGWLQARTNRDLAYVRLRQLLNLPDDQILTLTETLGESTPSAVVAAAPITTVNVDAADVLRLDPAVQSRVSATLAASDTSVSGRAAVRQAERGIAIATEQLKATKASRLPSLAATTNYQRLAYPTGILPTSLNDFFPNWTVGVGLSFPFFTGGRVKGEILVAEAALVEARERYKLAQEGATLDARSSTARLAEAEASWLASLGTAAQAQRAYEIAEVRFREGISTQLELSETRVQLQQAQANRARAARDLQIARKRLELLRDLPLQSGFNSSTGIPL